MSGEQLEFQLYCWLRGTNANTIFPVTVTSATGQGSRKAKGPDVDALKRAIAQELDERDERVRSTKLTLYKFSPRESDEEDTVRAELPHITLSDPRLSELSKGRESLSKIFPEGFDEPDKDFLHIVVDAFKLELLCWVQGKPSNQISLVQVAAKEKVGVLQKAIKKADPPTFRNAAAAEIKLYKVSLRNDNTLQGKLNNLQYGQPLLTSQILSEVFKDVPLQDHLHVVIGSLDPEVKSQNVIGHLRHDHTLLFDCLSITVNQFRSWRQEDVESNLKGGILSTDASRLHSAFTDIQNQLNVPRIYAPSSSQDADLRNAARYSNHFQQAFQGAAEGTPGTVRDTREFVTFFNIFRCYLADAPRVRVENSSSLKASTFVVNFILPAFFSGVTEQIGIKYAEQMPWKFPLFLESSEARNVWRKFTPRNDVMVYAKSHLIPLIISEVVSERNESDRWRMLLEAIPLARTGRYLMQEERGDNFFVVALYLTKSLVAERYIIKQVEQGNDAVFIYQKDFDLVSRDGAVQFFLEMHNLFTRLDRLSQDLDGTKEKSLANIASGAKGLISLNSISRQPKTTQSNLRGIREESSHEDLGGDLDDDLGVFGSEDIQNDMDGYDIQRVFGHPNVAIAEAENATKGDTRIYLLKYIDEDSKELHILQHLQGLVSPQNHTISTTNSWNVEDGTVIAMPTAGGWLTSLNNPGVQLWSVARQLFEAIAFMHEHGVAHMDIKPGNVIIPPDGGRLTIIDFSASVQVKGPQHMFRGVAGTEGYIAPEVRVKKYSPILADLWSCGKTLEELCGRCSDSTDSRVSSDRTTLLGMAKELMANDPSNRPTMSVLLERMDSIENTKNVETMKSVGSVGSVGSMESAESAEGMESVESAESMESTESMDSIESMEGLSLPDPSSVPSVPLIPSYLAVQA